MPFCRRLTSTAIALTALIGLPAVAEPQPSALSSQASDLRVGPRVGVGANSPGSGTETTTRLETFLPIWQQPGQSLTFFEGRLLIDDRGNPGGNVLLGHRQYSKTLNRTFGGHLGFDIRNTDNSTFQQLGLGLESLGDDVDLYLNGFLPVGTTQRQIGQRIVDTGLQLNGQPRFSGNALLLDLQRQRQITRQFEEALARVDFEVGKQLLSFKNGGDLQAFLGPYFLHSGIRGNTFGARLRLQMQPTRNLSAGVGIQHDDFFGTQVSGNLTFTFPGNRPKGPIAPENSVVARMGSSVNRTNNVIVDTPTTTEILDTENRTVAAINPVTGQPWFFNHVNLGLGNSDGSFESPFGTVAEALAATRGDGNDIVYVAQGTNPGIPAFTIPDNVPVLSRGPVQQINVAPIASQLSSPSTLNLGTVQLPASGNGQLPTVTGTVTMGNNTLLSGFDVQVDGAPALVADNITDATVRDSSLTSSNSNTNGITLNQIQGTFTLNNTSTNITNPTTDGIAITNTSGTVNLAANSGSTINDAGDDGVEVTNGTGKVTVSGLTLNRSGNRGVELNVADGDDLAVTLSNNQIDEARNERIRLGQTGGRLNLNIVGNTITDGDDGDEAIRFDLSGTNPELIAEVSGNTITNGQDGIESYDNSTASNTQFTITNNTVNSVSFDGIEFNFNNGAVSTTTISGNTVTDTRDDGIIINANDNTQLTSTISGNTVTNTRSEGIILNANGNTQLTSRISGNTVTDTRGEGININANNRTQLTTTISGNTIADTRSDGIFLRADRNAQVTATIAGNQITNANGDGIEVELNRNAQVIVNLSDNAINTTREDGIEIDVNGAGSTLTATVANNQITDAGDDSLDVDHRGNRICLALSNNTSTNPGSNDFELDPNGRLFQVVDLANVQFANTPNNSIVLETGVANFTDVNACP